MSTETTVLGFKATDKDIKCRDFQYVPGQWHEFEGELKLCESGFHFCEQPSGPWCYYQGEGTRIWKVEAQGVLDVPKTPGTDFKLVARRIRLVEEVLVGGYQNTGNQNTGNWNTGDQNTGYQNTGNQNTGNRNTGNRNTGNQNTGNWNTGDQNTGDQNTGNRNTGNRNTGNWNTGYQNTGNRNTGNQNTGNWNTGDQNTGDQNTGNRNTGNWNTGNQNTGNWNTGDQNTGYQNTGYQNTGYQNTGYQNTGYQNTGNWNATNFSAGFFCQNETNVMSFDVDSGLSRTEFNNRFSDLCYSLGQRLMEDEPIDFDKFATIPGITQEKLASLHAKFIASRTKKA